MVEQSVHRRFKRHGHRPVCYTAYRHHYSTNWESDWWSGWSALEATEKLLQQRNLLQRVELILDGHEHLSRYAESIIKVRQQNCILLTVQLL